MHPTVGASFFAVAVFLAASPSTADTSSVPDDPCVTLTDSDYLAHAFRDVLKRPAGLKLVEALRSDYDVDLPAPVDPVQLRDAVLKRFPGCCKVIEQKPQDAFEYVISFALNWHITDVELTIFRLDSEKNGGFGNSTARTFTLSADNLLIPGTALNADRVPRE